MSRTVVFNEYQVISVQDGKGNESTNKEESTMEKSFFGVIGGYVKKGLEIGKKVWSVVKPLAKKAAAVIAATTAAAVVTSSAGAAVAGGAALYAGLRALVSKVKEKKKPSLKSVLIDAGTAAAISLALVGFMLYALPSIVVSLQSFVLFHVYYAFLFLFLV